MALSEKTELLHEGNTTARSKFKVPGSKFNT